MEIPIISNWALIRLSGFLAYFLFTFSIAAGIMSRFTVFQKSKPLLNELHKTSGWTGLLAVIFHMTLLWRDPYVSYQLVDLLIPLASQYSPLTSAMGNLSVYLFLIVIATSDFLMKRLGRKLWGKIHLLVIPAWILMVLHGVFIGTDSNEPWAAFLYGGGVSLIIILLVFRRLESHFKALVRKNDVKKNLS